MKEGEVKPWTTPIFAAAKVALKDVNSAAITASLLAAAFSSHWEIANSSTTQCSKPCIPLFLEIHLTNHCENSDLASYTNVELVESR